MRKRLFDSRVPEAFPGEVHAMGTGEIMLYGRGPEWMQLFGAPYSCPTILSLESIPECPIRAESRRRMNSGNWEHHLENGEMTDVASRKYQIIARKWVLESEIIMLLNTHGFVPQNLGVCFPGTKAAYFIRAAGDSDAYSDYPIIRDCYMLLTFHGDCAVETAENGLKVRMWGNGEIRVTGAREFEVSVQQMRNSPDFGLMLEVQEADDRAFLKRCAQHRSELREHPLRGRVEEAIEDGLFMIRAQQHSGGGIQAGHNYHMAYVRDQYGDFRGLMAMGAWEEGRAILSYYRRVFERWGKIANAQGMGVEGIFHEHENDHVEITGYLILQATEFLRLTGDIVFFMTLTPMLKWALKCQMEEMHNGMLPFNGDETYVAGRILPRTALNHGAYEATMLFITGARRLIRAWRDMRIEIQMCQKAEDTMENAIRLFDTNFARNGEYVTNSLKRLDGLKEREFRHGVCNVCNRYFGWTVHTDLGIYRCPSCMGKEQKPCDTEYRLKSTLLMTPFVTSKYPEAGNIHEQTRVFLEEFRASGRLPSLPDGSKCLGYDYGLLLYAAARAGLEADDLLEKMLDLQDAGGAWSEYYVNGVADGTRCRPWESAINLAAAIRYLRKE